MTPVFARLGPALRGALVLPPAAYAVHQLRFALGGGDVAAAHGYLAVAGPVAASGTAVLLGVFLARVARAVRDGRVGRRRPGVVATWLATMVALVGVYATQESLEALSTSAHPWPFAAGGWVVVPVAAVIAAVVALVIRGAHRLVVAAARCTARAGRPRAACFAAVAVGDRGRRGMPPAPLPACAAGRAPPAGAVVGLAV